MIEDFIPMHNDTHEFPPYRLRKYKVTLFACLDEHRDSNPEKREYGKGGVDFIMSKSEDGVIAAVFRRCKEPSKIWKVSVKEI